MTRRSLRLCVSYFFFKTQSTQRRRVRGEEDTKVPIKPLHKVSKKQVLKEMKQNDFELTREFDGLPWQHMMFFGKDDAE